MDWRVWFAADERVVALPSWRRPRLLVPSRGARQRWRASALYPGLGPAARAARCGVRLLAASGAGAARRVDQRGGEAWPLGAWLAEVLPAADHAVVRYGTPSRVQKVLACVMDGAGEPIGYVKQAELPGARALLRGEVQTLRRLPAGVGPAVLKAGEFEGLDALALLVVPGEPMRPSPTPDAAAEALLERLEIGPATPIDAHPGAARLRAEDPARVRPWLAALEGRVWPVVIQHGDFLPWNLLRAADGTVRAVDWEYARRPGLPYMDWCQWVLQQALLLRQWTPARARAFARARLVERFGDLNGQAAEAVVSLAAFEAYALRRSEGFGDDDAVQRWRRRVWEAADE